MQLSEEPEARARRYRSRAANLRQQADAAALAGERADLLDIADQYDRIADRLLRTGAGAGLSCAQSADGIRRDRVHLSPRPI